MIEFWLAPVARGAHVAGLALTFGSLLGRQVMATPAARAGAKRFVWTGAVVAIVAGGVWFATETAAMAEAHDWATLLRAAPLVATSSRFGRLLLARLALIALAALCMGDSGNSPAASLATLLSAGALGLQAWTGHAFAIGGLPGASLASIETAHLLAAGAWLGALPLLFTTISASSRTQAEIAARRFSPLGITCVAVLAVTAFAQGTALIGGFPALFGTAYGRIALLKAGLFAALVALAAVNRFVLLRRAAALRLSVAVETLLGLTVIIAAAFLAQSAPGADH